MTVVNSKEFVANQKKYFDLALNEQVCIKRGRRKFHLVYVPISNTDGYDEVLEPDDDFRRAITMDEFISKALVMVEKVDKMYAKK